MSDFCILLIDDDPSINYLNKKMIEIAGIQAHVDDLTQASEALSQLSNGKLRPNLIILDLHMPVMDGWQFLEKFEQLPDSSRKTKIIVLSSTINPLDKEKAEGSPSISDFYSKPLSIEDLKKIENTFLSNEI